MKGYDIWKGMRDSVLNEKCLANENYDNPPFDFGVFTQTLSSGIVSSTKLFSKYLYCLWWGFTEFEMASQFRRFHSRQVQHTEDLGSSVYPSCLAALFQEKDYGTA